MRRFSVPAWLLFIALIQGCGPPDQGASSKTTTDWELPLPSVTISLSSKLTNLDILGSTPQPDIVTI